MPGGPTTEPISAPTTPDTPVSETQLIGLLGDWSAQGHGGLSRRLAHVLRDAISEGLLPNGARLPPERKLAELVSVSRGTVTAAFDELRSEALLTSRQGRGTTVVGPGGHTTDSRVGTHFVSRGIGVDLAVVVPPDASHLPDLTLGTADLVARGRGYLEPHGLPELRKALTSRYVERDWPTQVDQVQVTHGAHNAIALVVATVVGPGDRVIVEEPSYPGILDLLDLHRAQTIPWPVGPGGADPDDLGRLMRRHRPSLVYLQGGSNNPTGHLTSSARRRAIAAVCDELPATVVIEDNTLADLVFAGRPAVEVARLCRRAPVVSVESLSKVAWARLRLGWLRTPTALGERIGHVRTTTDPGGAAVPSQLLALDMLPMLDDLADRRRQQLAAAVASTAIRLHAELPTWSFDEPLGSSALWLELPVPDTLPFVALAQRHGVHVTPGTVHLVGGGPSSHIRLCVDRPTAVVDEGISRLVAAWADTSTPLAVSAGRPLRVRQ